METYSRSSKRRDQKAKGVTKAQTAPASESGAPKATEADSVNRDHDKRSIIVGRRANSSGSISCATDG